MVNDNLYYIIITHLKRMSAILHVIFYQNSRQMISALFGKTDFVA